MWTLFETTLTILGFVVSIHCATPFAEDHGSPGFPVEPNESMQYACLIDVNGARYGAVGRLHKLKNGANIEDAIEPDRLFPITTPDSNQALLLVEYYREDG